MNILDALDGRGIPYRRSGKTGEIYLCCPFCIEQGESQDERFRLGINIETGFAHCFNCEWRTRDIEFLSQELARAFDTDMFERGQVAKKVIVPVHLPEDFTILSKADEDHWGKKAYQYVHWRHVTDKQIREKKIGYSLSGAMKYRIVIPVYYQGKLKAMVCRDFTGKQEPKYKNSVGEKVIYNVPNQREDGAVLVEGVFDALAIERGCGTNSTRSGLDSLAVLGHSLTDLQLKQLQGYKKFILWPDPDGPGIFGFLSMVPELQRITKEIYLVTPKTKTEDYDPSEMFAPEVKERIKTAKPYTQELEQRLRAWLAFREEEE